MLGRVDVFKELDYQVRANIVVKSRWDRCKQDDKIVAHGGLS